MKEPHHIDNICQLRPEERALARGLLGMRSEGLDPIMRYD